jgi:ABC-type Na+ efflux pump permease subunit
MRLSRRRVLAIVRKDISEYRRNRSLVVTMAIFPLVFLIQPLLVVFLAPEDSALGIGQLHLLLYMLAIPVLVPATIAASAVAGERQQGTLEPVLTTPIPREEFQLAKALGVLAPTLLVSYVVYGVFLIVVAVVAKPAVAHALLQAPDILAQLVLTPLLALWSIWVGLAISTRASDTRVAQQLSLLGGLPIVLLTSLIAFGTIHVSSALAAGLIALLVAGDIGGWRVVAALFDRERLITGSR